MSESKTPEKQNLVQQIIGLAGDLFGWIKETLADEQARKATLMDLGLPSDPHELNLPQDSLDSIDRYRKARAEELDEEAFLSALDDILILTNAVKGFIEAAGVNEEAVIEEYAHRFFQLMTLSYFRLRYPAIYFAAQPFGFVEEANTVNSTATAYPERFVSVFRGVGAHFNKLGWDFDTEEQVRKLSDAILLPLAVALSQIPGFKGFLEILYGWEVLGDEASQADRTSDRALSILMPKTRDDPFDKFITSTLMLVPREHGDPGLFVAFGGSGDIEVELGKGWKLKLELTSGNAIDFLFGPNFATNAAADASVRFAITAQKDESQKPVVVGILTGSRLEFGAFALSGELSTAGVDIKLVAEDSALVIDAARDGDSFVAQTLPVQQTRIAFKFGLGWSTNSGLHLEGGAGLRAIIPIAQSLGPVGVQSLQLGLTPNTEEGANSLAFEVGAALDVKIGPVKASLDQIGFRGILDFEKERRNLGFVDLELGFKPPTGVGLSIDDEAVTGGGFLHFDPEKGQYGGVVQLKLKGRITIKGIGLLSTRLPDNRPGFSLLIIITAENLDIPLGLGFRLTAIGGLLAINRTFDEEALRTGLKNRTLDSVLFPKDPISNAPQLLSNLNKVFPPAAGHHLFGPVARIEWGTPTLITADLALVLELGTRHRLLLLAQIAVILPKPDNDLIRLQMDAIGVFDFDEGSVALDAVLYDSRLLKKFVLTGAMALRLNMGSSPNFALAIGGLHPAFNPPPNFPKLERIAINLTAGDNPRFRCEAYFALTANTVQFGARAELLASARGFSIHGEVGFDVLIQFSPFQFLAEFFAQVQVKRGSTNLFKVRVEGALAGPKPLHIKAKATFEILRFDVSVRIDKTLFAGEKPPLPEPVDVLPQLRQALSLPGNWVGRLPANQSQMVTLRSRADQPGQAATNEVLIHPLSVLTVKQGVVPLDMDISRFGQTTPAGARRFTIDKVSLGGQDQTTKKAVRDFFAPAQFFEMSDAEKLSRPSFDQMAAGVEIGTHEIVFDRRDCVPLNSIEFETKIYDREKGKSRPGDPQDPADQNKRVFHALSPDLLLQQAGFGAAGSSDLRRSGSAKYRTTVGKYEVKKEGWSIVATDDLTVRPAPGAVEGRAMSYSEAEQALERLQQEDPASAGRLKIMRFQSEVQTWQRG